MGFTKKSTWVTGLSFIVFIALMISFNILIPKFQIWGVLQATLIANVLMAILFFFAAQKVLKVNYNFGEIIGIPFIVFSFLFLLKYTFESNEWSLSSFGVTQFFLITFTIIAFNWNVITDYKKIFGKSIS